MSPRNHILHGVQIPMGMGNFEGKVAAHSKVEGLCCELCKKGLPENRKTLQNATDRRKMPILTEHPCVIAYYSYVNVRIKAYKRQKNSRKIQNSDRTNA